MTSKKFEELKKRYIEVREKADNERGERSVYFKIGWIQGELRCNKEGLTQEQVLELMEILF